jgi:glyoxylase-like metal-dependent hydrolase (beta-lactamase superfamily II)
VAEELLERLGIHRIPVPVPFPQAGGPVNVYAIEDQGGGLALFDAGLGSEEARAALEAGFRSRGLALEEVRRIVVSHGHVDHYGNAQAVVERAGGAVPVLAHAADRGKIAADGPRWRDLAPRYGAHLLRLGVPAETLADMAAQVDRGMGLARRVTRVGDVAEGAVLRFRRFEAEVLHMPGHTPGLVCLHDAAHRLFLAADHLLEKVSPNPVIELGPGGEDGFFRPLVAYLSSVARLRALEVDWVLPGHGPPFSGHRKVIDDLVAFYGRRQARIAEALARGPLTGHEVTQALFPRVGPRDLFLAVSEAVANLEAMETRGEVRRDDDGARLRFRLAA